MDGLIQFLIQAWRLIAIIVGLSVLAFFVWRRERTKKARQQQARKQQFQPLETRSGKQAASTTTARQAMASAPTAVTTVLDDDDDDDPLADLYAARAEAQQEGQPAAQTTVRVQPSVSEVVPNSAVHPPQDEDEEIETLAALLQGMGEDVPSKAYHRIAAQPAALQLVDQRAIVVSELLSIFRDDRDKRLLILLDDLAYRTLLHDKEAKTTFSNIMRDLSKTLFTPDTSTHSADVSTLTPHRMSKESLDLRLAFGGETRGREMMSIARDHADGRAVVQIGNTAYRSLVDHPKLKAAFTKIMKELSAVILSEDDNPPEVSPASLATSDSAAIEKMGYHDPDEQLLPGDIRIKKMDEIPVGYTKGRFGQVKIKEVEEKVQEIDIASAINAYLQYKIEQTPTMQRRGINIRTSLSGGVRIEVDGKNYDAVDEVDSPDVRDFIQQAISEWQERN